MDRSSNRIPILAGPTAGGKTNLAVRLARRLTGGGEVISADSMQVYRGMNIGTATPTETERQDVPHHLIDIVDPREVAAGATFTVDDWLPLANAAVEDIRARGRTPILAGGTNLYIQAFLYGLFEGPPADPDLRARLEQEPLADLRARLEAVDPAAAERIHRNDRRRTIRALEVYEQTGVPISEQQKQWERRQIRPGARLFILDWPASAINRRINQRVRQMMHEGLLEETERLAAAGALAGQPGEALGYKQLLEHLRGECTLEEAVERIKIETRRFGKNQRTWLRRLSATPGAVVLTCDEEADLVERLAARVLESLASERPR
jgi:tRNA dimethylallyltransferase